MCGKNVSQREIKGDGAPGRLVYRRDDGVVEKYKGESPPAVGGPLQKAFRDLEKQLMPEKPWLTETQRQWWDIAKVGVD